MASVLLCVPLRLNILIIYDKDPNFNLRTVTRSNFNANANGKENLGLRGGYQFNLKGL